MQKVTDELPLKWFRLPLYGLTVGLAVVTIAVGGQAVKGINNLENRLSREASQEDVTFMFHMTNIKALSALLIVVGSLLTIAGLYSGLILAYDWLQYLRFRSPRGIPRSTTTLRLQTLLLGFLSIFAIAIFIPTTAITRTGHATETVQGNTSAPIVGTDTRYWDYGFIRCTAAAPWFSLIFSIPATVITGTAYWLYKTGRTVTARGSFEDKP